jgi:hypothetical protein
MDNTDIYTSRTVTIPIEEYKELLSRKEQPLAQPYARDWVDLRSEVDSFLYPRTQYRRLKNGEQMSGNQIYTVWLHQVKIFIKGPRWICKDEDIERATELWEKLKAQII